MGREGAGARGAGLGSAEGRLREVVARGHLVERLGALALDALVLTLTLGAIVHAALAGKLMRLPLYFLIGLTLAQSSVRLGGPPGHRAELDAC